MSDHDLNTCPQKKTIDKLEITIEGTIRELATLREASIRTEKDIGYIKDSVEDIKELLVKEYVTKSDFLPIQRIVYGLVGIILTSVIVALITLVIRHG